MKKDCTNWFIYLFMAIFMISVTSCSEDEIEDDDYIWDFAPVMLNFKIVDSQGVNLIDEGGKLYGEDFKIIYNDKEYAASWNGRPIPELPESRAYLACIYGLYYISEEGTQRSFLRFEELDGGWCDADLKLVMPDGTSHDITIYRHITTKGPKSYVDQKVTFDGKVVDSLTDGSRYMQFTIVAN